MRTGLGIAVLEACALGTPVVASHLPCIAEIAAELPGIRMAPLEDEDAKWAQLVTEVAGGWSEETRSAARRGFPASGFTFDRTVRRTCQVWRRSRPGRVGRKVADG